MPAPLTVYRASAGAGKTFRLVVEYIKLLMLNPEEYKYILAVTFTKKATQEMKLRILSQLYGLREGLDSSKGYMECISKEMNLPKEIIRKNAAIALEMILNDYGHFHIETIDSFFQRVLRNMTHELDISSNMRVEINGTQVEEKAVDALIDSLEPSNHLFQRIVSFAEENMRDGKSWKIINELKSFGQNIFSNFYQNHAKQYKECLNDQNLFANYSKMLYRMQESCKSEIKCAAKSLLKTLDDNGLSDTSIFYRNNNGFDKLREYVAMEEYAKVPASLIAYSKGEECWFTKDNVAKYSDLFPVIRETILPQLLNYLDVQQKNQKYISTCKILLKNLNKIELLGFIEQAVNESNEQANRFLLSSTNQLLSEMIKDSDTPFIFEKIGTQIKHLMIDEFQDTSSLQWANFKVLMKECMSHYDPVIAKGTIGCMIVGDVKQSIYRWRDGDWELLNNINKQFDGEQQTEIIQLKTNFRSEANIINFNNAFFLSMKQTKGVEDAYDDVAQEVKAGRLPNGEIEFIMMSNEAYKNRHKMICDKVNQLVEAGVNPNDIAIIGRNNKILKELSKSFMEYYPNINVVSMESFIIGTSAAVNTIICALRLLVNPNDKILFATLVKKSGMSEDVCADLLASIQVSSPLLDIVEDIFTKFDLAKMKDDAAFVTAFFDHLKDFASKNTSTIRNFLKSWDESISKKTIETESVNGINMVTIHKSKGLEYDNVIIADGAWETQLYRNNIWIELNEEGLSDIPFTMVSATNELSESVFNNEYDEEERQFSVDNLNLLYVAFTRAGKNLYFYGRTNRKHDEMLQGKTAKKYSTSHICGEVEECLDTMHLDMPTSVTTEVKPDDDKMFYYIRRFGTFAGAEEEDDDKSKNVFDMKILPQTIELHLNKPEVNFVQSNRSKEFIDNSELVILNSVLTSEQSTTDSPQLATAKLSNEYLSTGLLLHYVLSQIETIDDVDTVLQKLEMEGVISDCRHSNLIKKRIIGNAEARRWFEKGWTVYNECTILNHEKNQRPDRVISNGEETIVIDYKFAKPDTEHETQVKNYILLLQSIGLPNVKGYLWYVYDDRVKEVKNV